MEELNEIASQAAVNQLVSLINTLRGENGCPWDKKQTPRSISVYLIEEVYELVDAIQSENLELVMEELGDVCFQVFFLSHLFNEAGHFGINEVIENNIKKMKRRHPHVFSNETVESVDDVKTRWRQIKAQEKNETQSNASILNSIPLGLPALLRAYRISERAAGIGFDWDDIDEVMNQVREEWVEFINEIKIQKKAGENNKNVSLEFGDILFSLVNVARFARIHPETALIESIQKFERRFEIMEQLASQKGQDLSALSRKQWDHLWHKAKQVGI